MGFFKRRWALLREGGLLRERLNCELVEEFIEWVGFFKRRRSPVKEAPVN